MNRRREIEPSRQTEQRLQHPQVEALVVLLLRNLAVFRQALPVLTPGHFSAAHEAPYKLLWGSALELYARYQDLPTLEQLSVEAATRAGLNPMEWSEPAAQEAENFLKYAFAEELTLYYGAGADVEWGYDLLQRFLKERYFIDGLQTHLDEMAGMAPADLPAFLQEINKRAGVAAAISRSSAYDMQATMASATMRGSPRPLGIPFLDEPMDKGGVPGEVYGLLGPTGVGKSTLGRMICMSAATQFMADRVGGKDLQHAIYVSYEASRVEVLALSLSYGARISKNHIMAAIQARNPEGLLSRQGRRHRYEDERWPGEQDGEWERYLKTVEATMPGWRQLDMTGPDDNPRAGSGWVDEIHVELCRQVDRAGWRPGLIVIDYVKRMGKRYIQAQGWDESNKLRHLMDDFADDARRLLAEYFGCQVWALQQLNPEANRRNAGARQHHSMSSEGGNFAENLWYAFCLGTKQEELNCCRLDATKTRRSRGQTAPEILYIDGEISAMESAKKRFTLDPRSSRIVPVGHGEQAPQPGQARAAQTAPVASGERTAPTRFSRDGIV